jgi:hypothetical protein
MQRRGFLALLGGLVAVAVTHAAGQAEAATSSAPAAPLPEALPPETARDLDRAPAEFSQYRRRYRRVYYRRPRRVYRRRVYYRRPVRRVYYRQPVRRVYYRRPVRVYRYF